MLSYPPKIIRHCANAVRPWELRESGSEASEGQEAEPRALLSFSEPAGEGRGRGRGPRPAAPQTLGRAAQGRLFWGVNLPPEAWGESKLVVRPQPP